MDPFFATLAGALVGGTAVAGGQAWNQSRVAKTDRRAQWLRFQRETVAGAQASLAEIWCCVAATDPNESPSEYQTRRASEEPHSKEAHAFVESTIYRSRLVDQELAADIKAWMTAVGAAIDDGPVRGNTRTALTDQQRALARRLGESLRDLHDPDKPG